MYEMEYKDIIKKEIVEDVMSFGEYPETIEDIMIYKEHLEEVLSKTKANIVLTSFQFGIASVALLSSIGLLCVGINDNITKEIIFGGVFCFDSLILCSLSIREIPKYKKTIELYRKQKNEMKELDCYVKTHF